MNLKDKLKELGIVEQDDPLHCPSGYQLDLYCKYDNPAHGYEEFPHGITTEPTFSRAIKLARKLGWLYHSDNTATCPKCARAIKKIKEGVGR